MSITEEYTEISKNFWIFAQQQQEKGDLFSTHYEKTYEAGCFDAKTKRLMAMCGALVSGCKGCILGQAQKAIAAGATTEEVLEACSVAFSLGGTMAGSKIALVVQLLREQGMMVEEG